MEALMEWQLTLTNNCSTMILLPTPPYDRIYIYIYIYICMFYWNIIKTPRRQIDSRSVKVNVDSDSSYVVLCKAIPTVECWFFAIISTLCSICRIFRANYSVHCLVSKNKVMNRKQGRRDARYTQYRYRYDQKPTCKQPDFQTTENSNRGEHNASTGDHKITHRIHVFSAIHFDRTVFLYCVCMCVWQLPLETCAWCW